MTPEERALYGAVEEYIASTWNQAGAAERTAVGFVMTIYRRRLASSFHALRATLRKHLDAIAVDDRSRLAGSDEDDRGRLAGLGEDDRSGLAGSDEDDRGRLASSDEDDRGGLASSDEDDRGRLAHLYHIFYQILLDQQITLIKFREWHYKCVQIEFCRAKSMVVELTGGYNRPTAHYGTTLASPAGNQQVRENFQRRPSQNRQIASRDGKDGLVGSNEDDRGRLAGSGEDDRSRLAGSDEDAPDDEAMDEMPDTDEIAELEQRALAAEEAHDIERLLDGIDRLPPDSKLESLKDVLVELREAGFAQTMVFTQFTDTMEFLREALRGIEGDPGMVKRLAACTPPDGAQCIR